MEILNWEEEIKKVIGNGELQEQIIKTLEDANTQIGKSMELMAMKLIRDIMNKTITKVEMLEKDIQLCRNKINELERIIPYKDNIENRIKDIEVCRKIAEKKLEECTKNLLAKPIECLLLTKRPLNALHNAEITTIGQLLSYSEIDLMEFDKFGKTSLKEIKEKLAAFGLVLKTED